MIQTKFYDRVREAQATQRPLSELPAFDAERMRSKGLLASAVTSLLENPRPVLAFLRRWKPTVVIGNFALVTRNADVTEILERQDVFETPFGLEMAEMAGGVNFVLGMQDGAAYRSMKSAILSAFPPAEVETKVRPLAAQHSRAILRSAMPGFDAASGLLKLVPVRICRDYFGMIVEDEDAFADWAIALSSLFFADFGGSATTRELAVVAAHRMREAIDRSIARVEEQGGAPATPLARLVAMKSAERNPLTDADIRSIMMGMISGFAPTNLLGAGNCLDVLLSRADAREAVLAAMEAHDDKALEAAIVEAMRFKPINVGPLRYVTKDTVIAKGTKRETRLKAGMTVMPATFSAMFDGDAVVDPERFMPGRPARDYMVFGHGIHRCIGEAIARVQIAECVRALFALPGLRRAPGAAGRLTRRGAFPEHLRVDFDTHDASKTVEHAFVTVVAPALAGVSTSELRTMVRGFGNPPAQNVADAFTRTGIVHFASLSVVTCADPEAEKPDDPCQIVLEFSADGSEDAAIAAVARETEPFFRPLFAQACGLSATERLETFMRRHSVRVSPALHSPTGLCFAGTPGHSVRRILAEDALHTKVAGVLGDRPPQPLSGALERLRQVREAVADGDLAWSLQPAAHGLEGAPRPTSNAIRAVLLEPANIAGVAVASLGLAALWYVAAFGGYQPGFWRNLLVGLGSGVAGILTLVLLTAGVAGVAYALLRRKEAADPERGETLAPARHAAIVELEDHMAHNHLAAISIVKPGPLRRLTLRLALFAVRLFARNVFPPGRLSDIGSIHFARWVLLPGTNRLMFFSNYGGSWESYLEDFITKASAGLTGVWSNTVGYPRSRNLFLDGATNGALFKRWAREQQIPTLFWYSAYPHLTTGRIRRNAAIRDGIASARTEAEAAAWLDRIASGPSRKDDLEAAEIQSIVFGGMGKLRHARMLAFSFPDDIAAGLRRRWLDHLAATVAFGDVEPTERATIAGFSGRGLMLLGLPNEGEPSFPARFAHGMAAKSHSRSLGDMGSNAPEAWRWGAGERAADAFLVLYAASEERLASDIEVLRTVSAAAGMTEIAQLPLTIETNEAGMPIEHFGYRDNISQPIIKGTPRARSRADAQHLVAPGEFLLGYADESGRAPPPIAVPAGTDVANNLADLGGREASGRQALRDFGRNGSFLVVRHMEQHVDAFDRFCEEAGTALGGTVGGQPARDWVGAKMLGRWKDGSSLVANPEGRPGKDADNGFFYGADDPQGRKCPFGAHVRRSNPRDSLGGDRAAQIRLSKRHRILRIGRTYREADEKGMLFMCLNADIDRQFAFVQQTWVMNGNFESLAGERDAFVGNPLGDGHFSIPGPQGPTVLRGLPSFVTLHGGGYFFMPGRGALAYLRDRS